jgi:hypothetical protein
MLLQAKGLGMAVPNSAHACPNILFLYCEVL